MSIQLKQTLSLKVSQDSGTLPKLLVADFSESFTDTDSYGEATSHVYKIATGTSDQQLTLGSLSSLEGLAIISDQAIEIKFNDTDGTSRELALKPNKLSIIHADFTALYISNDTGNEATIRLSAWGD